MRSLFPALILLILLVALVLAAAVVASLVSRTKLKKSPSGVAAPAQGLELTSSVFAAGGAIPEKYTCDGEDINPPLSISRAPAQTKSLALIMDDPDAPMGIWVHWLVWNIAAEMRQLPEGKKPPGSVEGKTSFGKSTYGGPCPPLGEHHYVFTLYALDTTLSLPDWSNRSELESAISGHILAQTQLVGVYKRK